MKPAGAADWGVSTLNCTSMEELKLLVVSLRGRSQELIENSLTGANYNFTVTHADSKKEALQAFGQQKFDLLISNCKLPDGTVTDLAGVLGDLLPCLVMAEGKCPFTAESILFVPETNYYISCSEQVSWLTHLESTMAIWEGAAKVRIAGFNNNYGELLDKALLHCAEELSPLSVEAGTTENPILNTLGILCEVLDLSRVYLCKKAVSENGMVKLTQTILTSSGDFANPDAADNAVVKSYPYFKRWDRLFSDQHPVKISWETLTREENSWWSERGIQSFLAIPVSFKENWDGFIGLEDSLHSREWSDTEVSFLESVADLIHDKHMVFAGAEKMENDNA